MITMIPNNMFSKQNKISAIYISQNGKKGMENNTVIQRRAFEFSKFIKTIFIGGKYTTIEDGLLSTL